MDCTRNKSFAIDRISTRLFTVTAARLAPGFKNFASEISTIHSQNLNVFGAAGFMLVSARTGVAAQFMLSSVCRSHENEILCWVFKPTKYAALHNQALEHSEVRIYNT